jgi:hypothetical protein
MQETTNADARDAVLVAGGVALLIFGAGLLLAHPAIRRTLLGGAQPLGSLGNGIGGIFPDVERYLKLKAM